MCEAFKKSLCLQILCDDARLVKELGENVQNINQTKLKLLIPQRDRIEEFKPWLIRLKVIATQIDECEPMLPLRWRDVAKKAGEVMWEEWERSNTEMGLASVKLQRPKVKILRNPK